MTDISFQGLCKNIVGVLFILDGSWCLISVLQELKDLKKQFENLRLQLDEQKKLQTNTGGAGQATQGADAVSNSGKKSRKKK